MLLEPTQKRGELPPRLGNIKAVVGPEFPRAAGLLTRVARVWSPDPLHHPSLATQLTS